MFRKAFSFGGLLLLAGAAVLVTPGSGQAQHRGGGGHFGGFHGGFQHGFHGGFHHGFRGFHHGFHHRFHDGFHHRFHGGRWWFPRNYGYYGAWPYYGYYPYYGYSNYYPYTSSSDWSSPAYDSGYYGSYEDGTSSSQDSDLSGTAQPATRAKITVSVPADAEIWFNGTRMTSTGSVREYQSPPLTPGSQYTYKVRARWNENGHEVTQTQQVKVTAGAHVSVKFPVHPTSARTAPSD
jgi:uncharacterized protein (TIGR03000 family)